LISWRATAEARLSEIIVQDRFSRNTVRATPVSFASDDQRISNHAINT
jgi:uncharacterized protein (DUF924 family)